MNAFHAAIRRLRDLEAAAKRDPGYESDHDHIESDAWRAYEAGWAELAGVIAALPRPDGWLAIEADASKFGDVTWPGVHGAQMSWLENHRSVRDLLVKAVTRRSMERMARPEDAALWQDPRVPALLQRLGIPAFPPPSAAVFRVLDLTVKAQAGFVVVRFGFETESAKDVVAQLIVRDTGERVPYTMVLLKKGPALDGFFAEGVTARIDGNAAVVRIPGPMWRSRKIAAGTALSIEVRHGEPWFLQGLAPAPDDPGDPHPDDYSADDLHCAGCGEATPVLIGVSCVPCEVGKLPKARPLAGTPLEIYEGLRRAWLETQCPECAGRKFAWRLQRPELQSLECVECHRGWDHFNGSIQGPDVIERALATPGPGPRWREVIERYFRGANDSDWVPQWLSLRDPAEPTPEWRETIRLLCEHLKRAATAALLFDSYDREHHNQVTLPAAARAEKILRNL